MSRERSVTGFVLKKQDYNEADQIITLFTREEGKLRALVKAANKATSKLRPALQPLFQSAVTLTGNSGGMGMMKVMRAQPVMVYSGILEDNDKLSAWYVAAELLMRALPDSAPNEQLYGELEKFAQYLHETSLDPLGVKRAITQFQIKTLMALGLGIRSLAPVTETSGVEKILFSLDKGGFVTDNSLDGIPISSSLYTDFQTLVHNSYGGVQALEEKPATDLQKLVNRFVNYQLEREIKSQRYFN